MTIPLMRSCREVTALLVAREDRTLGRADRIALRLHMVVCNACPRFENQMRTMRNGLRQWRNYTDNDTDNDNADEAKNATK